MSNLQVAPINAVLGTAFHPGHCDRLQKSLADYERLRLGHGVKNQMLATPRGKKGSECAGTSRRKVAVERVARGKTQPVASASSDACWRATSNAKPTMLRTVPAEVQPGREIELRKRSFVAADRCSDRGKATVMSNDHGESDVTPTESKTTRTVGNFPRGSRETPAASASREADRSEKARCRKSDKHAAGESDNPIVPATIENRQSPPA